jgi:hypothetical protein
MLCASEASKYHLNIFIMNLFYEKAQLFLLTIDKDMQSF